MPTWVARLYSSSNLHIDVVAFVVARAALY